MSSKYDPVKMCSELEPVEEITQHTVCKAVSFSNTVFSDLPLMICITVFEKLPAFTSKLVYEDSPVSVVN